jgi:hypothetical protein
VLVVLVLLPGDFLAESAFRSPQSMAAAMVLLLRSVFSTADFTARAVFLTA